MDIVRRRSEWMQDAYQRMIIDAAFVLKFT
jgi:hypothetical protein